MGVTRTDGPVLTFPPGAAIAKYLRVKLSSGKLAKAGTTDVAIGNIELPAYGDLSPVTSPVRARNAPGTTIGIASEAITAPNVCYAGADGKYAATGTIIEGRALTSPAADGDQFELLPMGDPSDPTAGGWMGTAAAVTAAGTNQGTAAALTNGVLNYVTAADDAKGVVLPAAVAGKLLRVYNADVNSLFVYPGTSDTINGGAANAAVTVPPRGSILFECYDATDWLAIGVTADAQTVLPTSAEGAGNSILTTSRRVIAGAPVTNADDFIVLPAIASVPIGHQIVIAANGSSNFELRTPASSGTTINDVDSDGTQEYLVTDTHMVIVTKRTTTGWMAQSYTKLGAVVTAVIPD